MLCLRNEDKRREIRFVRTGAKTPDLMMYKGNYTMRKGQNGFVKRENHVVLSGKILPMILPFASRLSYNNRFNCIKTSEIRDSQEKIKTATFNIKKLLQKYENTSGSPKSSPSS
jgi:hypothetical protein